VQKWCAGSLNLRIAYVAMQLCRGRIEQNPAQGFEGAGLKANWHDKTGLKYREASSSACQKKKRANRGDESALRRGLFAL
jgi:hypothetical protein